MNKLLRLSLVVCVSSFLSAISYADSVAESKNVTFTADNKSKMIAVSLWSDHDVTLGAGSGIQNPAVDKSCSSSKEGCIVSAGSFRDFVAATEEKNSVFYISYKISEEEQGKGSGLMMFLIQPDGTLTLMANNVSGNLLIANLVKDEENHYTLKISDKE